MAHSPVYKENTYTVYNDDAGLAKIRKARREVDARQNHTTANALFNILLSIAGLFSQTLGFTSLLFSGAETSNDTYLEKLENFYTIIEEDMANSSLRIMRVIITDRYKGTWHEQADAYRYSALLPRVEYVIRP